MKSRFFKEINRQFMLNDGPERRTHPIKLQITGIARYLGWPHYKVIEIPLGYRDFEAFVSHLNFTKELIDNEVL